jgi:hypothetical protein
VPIRLLWSGERSALIALNLGGWRVLTVWECALRGKHRQDLAAVIDACEGFLNRPDILHSDMSGCTGTGAVNAHHLLLNRP